MIYPIGCNLVIENLQTRQQEFLLGHNNNISCVTISNNGKYIASGQVTFMGFKVYKTKHKIFFRKYFNSNRRILLFGIMLLVNPMHDLFYIKLKSKILFLLVQIDFSSHWVDKMMVLLSFGILKQKKQYVVVQLNIKVQGLHTV